MAEIKTFYQAENKLKEYPSYTYGISLHMLSPTDFNAMTFEGSDTYRPKNVLIASAGRANNTNFVRDKNFNLDFYIEDLKIETIIGMNKNNRGSNATTIDFTVIEPYGVTLIDRIIAAAADITKYEGASHLTIPYLLQVDFFGWDENGLPVNSGHPIAGLTRRIPLRLTKIDIRVSSDGAQYSVSAIAFNQQALGNLVATVNSHISITAKTVGEFLGVPSQTSDVKNSEYYKRIDQNQRIIRATNEAISVFNRDIRDVGSGSKSRSSNTEPNLTVDELKKRKKIYEDLQKKVTSEIYEIGTLSEALNAWASWSATERDLGLPDLYSFNIDPDIAKAELNLSNQVNRNPAAGEQDRRKEDVQGPNWKGGYFTVNAGSNVLDVISMAIKQSSYISSQIQSLSNDERQQFEEAERSNKVDEQAKWIDWFQIIPKIYLGEYVPERNDFKKEITYQIVKFRKEDTTQKDGADKLTPVSVFKEYNYFYTGKNDDVLDLQIEFNTAYYVALDASRAAKSVNERVPSTSTNNGTTSGAKKKAPRDKLGQPTYVTINVQNSPGGTDRQIKLVNEWEQGMIYSSAADMVTATLKVIGDPDFIKQDDILLGNRGELDENGRNTVTGTIPTDRGDVFCLLNFRTPLDYGDNGLADFGKGSNAPEARSFGSTAFSGLYRVIKVTNTFNDGQFTQELELVRAANQRVQI